MREKRTYPKSTPAKVFTVYHFESNKSVESAHEIDKDNFVEYAALDAHRFEWQAGERLGI